MTEPMGASGESQKQSASTEKDFKEATAPEGQEETQFFDTMINKLVKRENPETGEEETVEVMSNNLEPGEVLARASDEKVAMKKAEERKEQARKAAENEPDNRDRQ